jgi:hypothetical protein
MGRKRPDLRVGERRATFADRLSIPLIAGRLGRSARPRYT